MDVDGGIGPHIGWTSGALIVLKGPDVIFIGYILDVFFDSRDALFPNAHESVAVNVVITKTQNRDAAAMPMQAACAHCALNKLCHAHGVPAIFQSLFPLVDEKRIRLGAGEFLFRAGDPQVGIYAVKAGFLKSCVPLTDGRRNIVAFHAMGDAVGLDGLGRGVYATDGIALNGCEVCLIPLAKFEKLLEHPAESTHLRQLLGRELARIEAHAAVVGTLSAKQRVATFLLDMSVGWEQRGYSKHAFVLFMSRNDIGNFLGLTFETISRTLSYFQTNQWIVVHGKHVVIRNMEALQSQLPQVAEAYPRSPC